MRINPIVNALSLAISDFDIIRDIAMRSELAMRYARIVPEAESYWEVVLERGAGRGRMPC